MGFVDKLRSAKHYGYSNPNRGTEELLSAALREEMKGNRLDSAGGYFGGGGNRRGFLNSEPSGAMDRLKSSTQRLGIQGKNFDGMNVVYDQRPEMQQKQLNLQKQGMAQDAKLEEAKNALMSMKLNDDFIDTRRDNTLKQKQVDTQDWAARNLKPGEMSDREKVQAEYDNRHALNTQNNIDKWVNSRENNAAREREVGMRGEQTNEAATIRAEAAAEAARIRAEATTEAARMRLEASGTTPKKEEVIAPAPVVAPDAIGKELERLLEPGAAPMDDAMRRDVARRANPNADIPTVAGINSNIKTQGSQFIPKDESKSLDPRTGELRFVDMVDPKGRPLRVPAHEVDALLKKGAKRR